MTAPALSAIAAETYFGSQPTPCVAADTTVYIDEIILTRFRNYSNFRLHLDARPVVLVGENGAGKTNLMEAVSLLSPGRGLRRARQDCLLYQPDVHAETDSQQGGWGVAANVITPEGVYRAGTASGNDAHDTRRTVKIDGEIVAQSALAEKLSVSWLTPDMNGVLAASPTVRRRFFDRLALSFDPAHMGRLARFERTMRQRNLLLEDRNCDQSWLEAIEHQLASTGVAIIAARRALVDALAIEALKPQPEFPAVKLTLSGEVETWLDTMPAIDVEDRIRHNASEKRREGRFDMPGPHQSLFTAIHSVTGKTAEASSTGETKALLISAMLAHARLQKQRLGRPPILLLDDIVAHLDYKRREALFDLTADMRGQVWFSTTDKAMFATIADTATILSISAGAVS